MRIRVVVPYLHRHYSSRLLEGPSEGAALQTRPCNTATRWPDSRGMSDERATPGAPKAVDSPERRRDHLRLVTAAPIPAMAGAPVLGATAVPRPRTIGRLIAQTALIADSAVTRKRMDRDLPGNGERGIAGKLLGKFR
ncbi:MAG: hypothetical protein JWM25_1965 [Thermoleophilia bacterium]|nr:hypothetical protein [Thermoleophilia bacterium]